VTDKSKETSRAQPLQRRFAKYLKPMIAVGIVNALATTALGQSSAFRRSCTDMFGVLQEEWKDPVILRQRLALVVAHQNKVRGQKKVPEISENLDSASTSVNSRGEAAIFLENADAFPDDPIAGFFYPYDKLLIRGHYIDIYSLNFVYDFRKNGALRVSRLTDWLLRRTNGDEVTLYRSMGETEFNNWKNGKLNELGSRWGHGTNVTHFSTAADFTSAGGSREIAIRIKKRALKKLAQKNSLWAGIIDRNRMICEIVFASRDIPSLVASGDLVILRDLEKR